MRFAIIWQRRRRESRGDKKILLEAVLLLERRTIAGQPRQQIVCRLANIDETRLTDHAAINAFWHDAVRRIGKLARLTPDYRREIEIDLAKTVRKPLALVQSME
jgi:hypothetical protein